MACEQALHVQAYFDGELDATTALDVELHVSDCAACSALLKDLAATRAVLRRELPYHRADARLRAQVGAALDKETGRGRSVVTLFARSRDFWTGAVSGGAAAALAAAAALFLVVAPVSEPLVADLVNAHLRSVMSDHTIDVASNDHHTVKPWFATHTDVSPPVADFEAEGYRLVGGRADYVDGRRTAVIVYRHGAHIINVFAWADRGDTLPAAATRNGYHAMFWRNGNLVLCAVSDTGWDELSALQRLLSEKTKPGGRE